MKWQLALKTALLGLFHSWWIVVIYYKGVKYIFWKAQSCFLIVLDSQRPILYIKSYI